MSTSVALPTPGHSADATEVDDILPDRAVGGGVDALAGPATGPKTLRIVEVAGVVEATNDLLPFGGDDDLADRRVLCAEEGEGL